MPIYSYKCAECDTTFDKVLSRAERSTPQTCVCGGTAKQVVGNVGFVMKGDGWVGKNVKIKEQMATKNAKLDQRGREKLREAPGVRLVPNVGGERVESWEEAKRLAKSQGLSTDSYDQKIQQEKK